MQQDYTVFVHLVDSSGTPLAQRDSQPLAGEYPTSWWRAGERVIDPYLLEIPSSLAPGEYDLLAGFYLLSNGQRLPLLNQDGDTLGESAHLDLVTIRSE
jgi:hypothetical protein